MPGIRYPSPYICARCLRGSQQYHALPTSSRTASRQFSQYTPLPSSGHNNAGELKLKDETSSIEPRTYCPAPESPSKASRSNAIHGQGAMSRRLAEATEEALLDGGRAGRKAVEEAGFSEELKNKLLEKVEATKFQSDNASVFAEAGITPNVGQSSRQIATGQAWMGQENPQDTIIRMLEDAHPPLKPSLRGAAKIPSPVIDLRLKGSLKQRPGERLANARDKTSIYATSKDSQMSVKEREQMRRDLKERFGPGVGTMPNSFRGLAALANERIEDAIARGQFKNIPRGKGIVRDARADNPFIDTTEYIMNKMIQRQDIVPPWIEKQQELVKTANIFRTRLRNDWKRHAARTIASRGGSLEEQMRMADCYAEAERVYNPKRKAVELISLPTKATSDPVLVNVLQKAPTISTGRPLVQVSIATQEGPIASSGVPSTVLPNPSQNNGAITSVNAIPGPEIQVPESPPPLRAPFRIPSWEQAESSYLKLAVQNLNTLTRSYNLMAPDLAKKPYFSLDRELRSCYADVAPQLSQAIKERAARPPKELVEKIGHRPGGVLERFASDKAVIYDSKKPLYGFREFWGDLWGEKSA